MLGGERFALNPTWYMTAYAQEYHDHELQALSLASVF